MNSPFGEQPSPLRSADKNRGIIVRAETDKHNVSSALLQLHVNTSTT